jgi:hypothetical protein
MFLRSSLMFLLPVFLLLSTQAFAQGGWRQWEIYFLDGTSVEASPLQLRNDGRFTRSMDPKEAGFAQARIDYLAATTKQLPPAPTGKYKQDVVVMLDGKRAFGKVRFKTLKFSEGTFVQNGKEISLENVAYIKFAHPAAGIKRSQKD